MSQYVLQAQAHVIYKYALSYWTCICTLNYLGHKNTNMFQYDYESMQCMWCSFIILWCSISFCVFDCMCLSVYVGECVREYVCKCLFMHWYWLWVEMYVCTNAWHVYLVPFWEKEWITIQQHYKSHECEQITTSKETWCLPSIITAIEMLYTWLTDHAMTETRK